MHSLLKPLSDLNLTKAKGPSLVLVMHAVNPAGYTCAQLVQRQKDVNKALTLLQGAFDPLKEIYTDAVLRILQNHFEMPSAVSGIAGPMVKEVGEPIGYVEHDVPKDRKKGTKRTLIYVPLLVSMRIKVRQHPMHPNPVTSSSWLLGRDIDAYATVMGQMRDPKKWLAHVEAVARVLRPAAKQREVRAA